MKIEEALPNLPPNENIRFVGRLVPPMIAFANGAMFHTQLANDSGLGKFDMKYAPAYIRPKDEKNFRAGFAKVSDGSLKLLDEASTAYEDFRPTEDEFQTMLQGEVRLVTPKR